MNRQGTNGKVRDKQATTPAIPALEGKDYKQPESTNSVDRG